MSYSSQKELDLELREVLFLILAEKKNPFIQKMMGCKERKVTYYIERLMKLFFKDEKTNVILLYHAAKRDEELCKELAEEFGHRYPDLVPIVLKRYSFSRETVTVKGVKTHYVFHA